MSLSLPPTKHVALSFEAGRLDITFNRPEVRNAMSLEMVTELESVLDAVLDDRSVRVMVVRGAGGNFCAGGDIKDMARARAAGGDGEDALARTNRRFGHLITKFNRAPAAVVGVLEGAVMGGGFGLSCVVDVAIAEAGAKFRLPETGLGIPPAQIAPFLVQRLGASQARRLAVTGASLDGAAAAEIGLVHEVVVGTEALEQAVAKTVRRILRCAPGAVAATKRLMVDAGRVALEELLDRGAAAFSEAARGPEGVEGMTAFLQKRAPYWTPEADT